MPEVRIYGFIKFPLYTKADFCYDVQGKLNGAISIKYRINHQIKAKDVRLIGAEGEQIGVISLPEALRKAEDEGLDLVEISPTANPPVAKIIDWGKFKYEKRKQEQSQRKKQKNVEVKGIRLSSKIGEHDLETKAKTARKFLNDEHKVKVRLLFKGREITHKDVGERVLRRFAEKLEDVSTIEQDVTFTGREAGIIIAPKKKE